MTTMRALVLPSHGEVDTLRIVEDHPVRDPGEGEVLVRVTASSLNYHDVFTVRGMPGITIPFPVVIGLDAVGVVERPGRGVTGWAPGDRVLIDPIDSRGRLLGEVVDGGAAQYTTVEAAQLVPIPDGVTDVQAAALPVAYGTAHRMVVGKGAVHAGDTVLVLGASGGVGTAAVLLAKQLGAHVIAAVGDEAKRRRLLELGADEAFDYRQHPIDRWVREHHGKPSRFSSAPGVDVVVNFTGGDTWLPTLRSVSLGGRILVCGATAGFAPTEDLRYIWSFEQQVIGSNGFAQEDFIALLDSIARGSLEPVVDSVVGLDGVVEGLRRLEGREIIGKVVIDPWREPAS